MIRYSKIIKVFVPIFDGEGDGKSSDNSDSSGAAAKPAASSGAGTPKTFTQEQLDKIVEDRLKRVKDSQKSAITELEALKSKAQLTQQERDELETRLEGMRNEFLTKEELSSKEKSKLEKQFKDETERLSKQAQDWQNRYTNETITRSITDAAAKHVAYNPGQVVALLRQDTKLVDVLDENGKPTGNLIPKVKFADKDKDGKPVTLELEVDQAVKRMTELEEFANLFKDSSSGGVGGRNVPKGQPLDIKKMSPEQYRKARAEGKIAF